MKIKDIKLNMLVIDRASSDILEVIELSTDRIKVKGIRYNQQYRAEFYYLHYNLQQIKRLKKYGLQPTEAKQ